MSKETSKEEQIETQALMEAEAYFIVQALEWGSRRSILAFGGRHCSKMARKYQAKADAIRKINFARKTT